MSNVILTPNDYDKELYQKLSETAADQNLPMTTVQRNILCEIFNIPKDHVSETQYYLLHEALYERCIAQKISLKYCVRNCFRDYFGMPVPRVKLQYEKKGGPLQQREKRFQILGFLVTVDAVTRQEIADQLKTTKKNVEGILNHNSHYFESFRIPYDKQYRWRATEKGKQDYFASVNIDQTVRKLKLEEAEEAKAAEKAEKRRKFEWMEQKRKELEKTTKAEKKKEQKKEQEKIEQEKCGIEKYFLSDPSNPNDVEIVRRLEALGRDRIIQQERFCKVILGKQLSVDTDVRNQNTEHRIEQKLLQRCQEKGITRNELIRELFCAHFNIRMDVRAR